MTDAANVFRKEGPVVGLAEADWAALLPAAKASPLRRSRICLHASDDDLTQEMVVCLLRDSGIRPHRHTGKSESYHLLSGRMRLVLFDDAGRVSQAIPLAASGEGTPYYCRLSQPVWHTVLVDSDHVLFHETTTGPFRPGETEFAPWAKAESAEEALKFTLQLRTDLDSRPN